MDVKRKALIGTVLDPESYVCFSVYCSKNLCNVCVFDNKDGSQ